MTHFLCIPVSTPRSRPKIVSSFRRIMPDPVSSDIPKPGFLYPEELRLTTATMSLKTPEKAVRAVTLLDDIGLPCIVERVHVSQTAHSGHDTKDLFSSPSSCFEVTMHGLVIRGLDASLDRRFRLWAIVFNADNSLQRVCSAITQPFEDAELVAVDPIQTKLAPYYSYNLCTPVIDTSKVFSDVPKLKPSLTQRGIFKNKLAIFDASALFEKYYNVVWAENFKLQRLCACEIGLQNIVKGGRLVSRGYREIASVPLPGGEAASPGHGRKMSSM